MYIARIESVLLEIKNLPPSMVATYPPVSEKALREVENTLRYKLPDDFKCLLFLSNGLSIMGETVYPIGTASFSKINPEDVLTVYQREHGEVVNPMPDYYLPFSPNGRGDHYCFDLKRSSHEGVNPVIFWQWDYSFFNPHDIETTHNSFCDWLEDLVSDIKEELTR